MLIGNRAAAVIGFAKASVLIKWNKNHIRAFRDRNISTVNWSCDIQAYKHLQSKYTKEHISLYPSFSQTISPSTFISKSILESKQSHCDVSYNHQLKVTFESSHCLCHLPDTILLMKWTYLVLNFKAWYMQQTQPVYGSKWVNGGLFTGGLSEILHLTYPARNGPESEQVRVNTKIRAALQHSSLITPWETSGSVTARLLTHSSLLRIKSIPNIRWVFVKIVLKSWGGKVNKYILFFYIGFKCRNNF